MIAARTRTLLALTGAAVLLGLAACAPGPGSEGPGNGTGGELATGDTDAAFEDWRRDFDSCLRAEGIDLPSADETGGMITLDAGELDLDAFQAAQEKCIGELGEPPVQEGAPTEQEAQAMALAFAKCMREAGYDYPDPEFTGSAMQAIPADEYEPADIEKCSTAAGADD